MSLTLAYTNISLRFFFPCNITVTQLSTHSAWLESWRKQTVCLSVLGVPPWVAKETQVKWYSMEMRLSRGAISEQNGYKLLKPSSPWTSSAGNGYIFSSVDITPDTIFHWYNFIVFHEYNPGMNKAVWKKTFLFLKGLIQAVHSISHQKVRWWWIINSSQYKNVEKISDVFTTRVAPAKLLSLNWTTFWMCCIVLDRMWAAQRISVHFLVSESQRELPSDNYFLLNTCISQRNAKSWGQGPLFFTLPSHPPII